MEDDMKFIDGASQFNIPTPLEFWHNVIWTKTAARRGISPPENYDNQSHTNPAYLHISTGRLVASCPNCNGAEYVWADGPYLMLCANCGNKDIEGKLRQVVLPEKYDDISRLLLARPNPDTQNWFPGETIETLEKENEDNL